MKKFLALLLAMVMMLGLVACGGTNSNAGNTGNNSQQTDNTGNTGDEGGDSTDSPDIKIGVILIHDENSGYDVAHIDGITQACENLGIDMANVSFKYNIAEDSNCYDAAADLADSGCDIIFSDSYGHQAFMLQAAQDFPDITFVACTGDQAGVAGQDNLKNIFPYTYESRYVSGVVAGMKLKELLDSLGAAAPETGFDLYEIEALENNVDALVDGDFLDSELKSIEETFNISLKFSAEDRDVLKEYIKDNGKEDLVAVIVQKIRGEI